MELMKNHPTLSDEELCLAAQKGGNDAGEQLARRYMRLVKASARPFFLAGGDGEDLMQEGFLGLLKAMREYSPAKQASFHTFATLCIRNQIFSAVKKANRGKHKPLNTYIPIGAPSSGGVKEHASLLALYPDRHLDPEALIIGREEFKELTDTWKGLLSDLESEILGHYLEGLSYREIAAITRRSPKSVDNAVQRARKKLADYWR